MSKTYSPKCSYVVAVDPGKTYGVALYGKGKGGVWALTNCRVDTEVPLWLSFLRDYECHLICEGTSFGGAGRYIQRCIGRFEGALNTQALTVTVGVWRRAVFTPSQFKKTQGKNVGRVKWKSLAVQHATKLGYRLPDRKDNDHAAEAALIGHGYVHGMIPVKKIHGLP